ncbi:hypothetical protein [Chamaesiphon sp. VAR_69_metabat_338]|uniref:hypothetical protein n=1 Tax=Chamaesiphon sp. VAR_69_metabat_338 TaxID=2964704 RepID=UPI00286DABB6|nr:hypothetical protein [Chamaesiphon sp. VAR_69_metabat_338]
MKIYLACLLLITSSIGLVPPTAAVAKPKPADITTVVAPQVISPAAALNRLIVAEKLDASWFTPAFLKAVDKNSDVNAIQMQRDFTMKLGRFRYGNYKSVQSIGSNKYRVLFDRAEPDAVIVQLSVDAKGRIAEIGISEKNKPAPTAQAQAAAQVALDKSFKTNTRANGEVSPVLVSLKQWLGNYQKVKKVDATKYLGMFERGSAPVTINFKPDGSIENYSMGCPTTKVSLKQAPENLQKIFATCPNLK